MPGIDLTVDHALGADEASRRVRGLMSHLRVKYGTRLSDVDEWWGGHTGGFEFKLMGANIKGETFVNDRLVQVRASLPFAAMMFKSSIEKAVRDEVVNCLREGP